MKSTKIRTAAQPDKLISYWTCRKGLCVGIAITGTLYNLGMLASPYFEGVLIDLIESEHSDFLHVFFISLIFVLTMFVVDVFRAEKRYLVRRFANKTITTMRYQIYNSILNESIEEISHENIGTLLNRCQSDCAQTIEGMRKLTTEIFDTVMLFIFYIIYLILYDLQMTLFALIPVFVAIVFAFIMRKKIYKANLEAKKTNAVLSNQTYSYFDNAMMNRIYSRDEDNLKKYDKTLKEYEKKSIFSALLTETSIPLANIIALSGLIPIILIGTSNVIAQSEFFAPIPYIMNETWTIGAFSTYITTFVLLATKASHTAKLFSSVQRGLSGWQRIKPYMKPYHDYEKPEKLEGDSLELKDFAIKIDDQYLFHDLNLKAKKGEIIALTGEVASGKSAFGKVFIKEMDYEGSALLFNKEIRDYSFAEIKGNVTYMGHHSELLTTSIKENIAFDHKEDIKPYLDLVAFDKDMESMPDGENTIVGNEGIKLSGGQQERIALARTFYHKKGLVILDDPFASVDIQTEHKIMYSLREEAKDSIILFFSHRLSYFPYCDKVIVINHDKSISVGSHQSLLEEDETYKMLFTMQKMEVEHE